MNLTCKDIINRQRNLITDSYYSNPNCNVNYLYENLEENYSYSKAKLILENWNALSDQDIIALDKVLEVFSIIVANDSESNIRNAANIIEGKIIPKVRDGKATRHLNNYKLGKLKIQNTKVLNHTKDNENANAKARANGGYLGNSLHPHRKYKRDIYGNKIGEDKKGNSGSDSSSEQDDSSESKSNEVEECVNSFIHASWVNDQCDRVISNHNKLIRRFDLESKVRNCAYTDYALQECVLDICKLIDGYDLPFGVKYNIALENILYLMNKNCVPVTDQFILENVTDYFLMQDITDDRIHDMNYIIENSKFFSDEDLKCVSYLHEDEDMILEQMESEDEFQILKEAKDPKKKKQFIKFKKAEKIHTSKKKEKIEKFKIKKAIHEFKKNNKKSIESAKVCMSRIFVNSPENIINELPDIFGVVRIIISIGAFGLNPVLGLITVITGYFLKMKVSRERMAVVVEQYTKEMNEYKKKMDNAESDKDKEKYTKLYKEYKEAVNKLEMYESELYTEKENDKRDEERWAKEYENMDDDDADEFDFGFDDDDFNFDVEEQSAISYVNNMSSLCESMLFTKQDLMNTIKNNISNLDSEDIYNITESVKLCNDIFDCPEYVNILEDELTKTRQIEGYKTFANYQRIDALKTCIYEVNEIKYDNLLESYAPEDDNIPIDLLYENLKCKHDVMTDTLELATRYKNNSILEAKENSGISFTSKLKIASENLRRNALKLKDKDKQLSNKMDSELGRVMKSAKNAMISDSRENIIKGSFLPSASRCIKLAITTGVTCLFNPVFAVIGVIGYIGCSKKLSDKERNLILDDIDIEIEMCEKYLKAAEDRDDLVAVREIMKTKRDLERQRARILYNKKYVIKGKKPYDYRPASLDKKDD